MNPIEVIKRYNDSLPKYIYPHYVIEEIDRYNPHYPYIKYIPEGTKLIQYIIMPPKGCCLSDGLNAQKLEEIPISIKFEFYTKNQSKNSQWIFAIGKEKDPYSSSYSVTFFVTKDIAHVFAMILMDSMSARELSELFNVLTYNGQDCFNELFPHLSCDNNEEDVYTQLLDVDYTTDSEFLGDMLAKLFVSLEIIINVAKYIKQFEYYTNDRDILIFCFWVGELFEQLASGSFWGPDTEHTDCSSVYLWREIEESEIQQDFYDLPRTKFRMMVQDAFNWWCNVTRHHRNENCPVIDKCNVYM